MSAIPRWAAHEKHWARGFPRKAFGDAPEHRALHATATMRAQHHEVSTEVKSTSLKTFRDVVGGGTQLEKGGFTSDARPLRLPPGIVKQCVGFFAMSREEFDRHARHAQSDTHAERRHHVNDVGYADTCAEETRKT
jgi:hypothetical protein